MKSKLDVLPPWKCHVIRIGALSSSNCQNNTLAYGLADLSAKVAIEATGLREIGLRIRRGWRRHSFEQEWNDEGCAKVGASVVVVDEVPRAFIRFRGLQAHIIVRERSDDAVL